MADSPEIPGEPRQRLTREYQDPHFHDDDDLPPPDEEGRPVPRSPRPRLRLQNPPRRYPDD